MAGPTKSPRTKARTTCTAARSASANGYGACSTSAREPAIAWCWVIARRTARKVTRALSKPRPSSRWSRDVLSIALSARTDAATPINLTYHPYFNLPAIPGSRPPINGCASLRGHYLPVAAGLIPTGEIAPVEGTTFDFRHGRRLRPPALQSHPQLGLAGGYDHCWVLDADADCACELASPNRDVTLTMSGGPGPAVLQRAIPVAQPSGARQRRDPRAAGLSECSE